MNKFGFLIHPLRAQDVGKRFPVLTRLPDSWIEWLYARFSPRILSHVTGVRSLTGEEIEGWFILLPRTPRQLLEMPTREAYDLITRCGEIAQELGARIFGLGAFSKVIGDKGISVARRLQIPVTTGNSYTAATAIEGALLGAGYMGIDVARAHAAVVGATGVIGSSCAHVLARTVNRISLIARNETRLRRLASAIRVHHGTPVAISTDAAAGIRDADVIIAVSSATGELIAPEALKPGAVVCDVARPRNISPAVHAARDDVLVMDGGVIRVPGEVDLGISLDLPPGCVEACIAETMILTLEGRFEPYTLGANITPEKLEEIDGLARKHGFAMACFRRFDVPIPEEDLKQRRERAVAARGRLVRV